MMDLPNARTLLGRKPLEQTRLWDAYCVVARTLSQYLRAAEGIEATALYEGESDAVQRKFDSFSVDQKTKKFEKFVAYYSVCSEIVERGISLAAKDKVLRAFMKRFGLRLPREDEVFSYLGPDVFVEIYDKDFIQVFRSADFFNVTSHSIMALETFEWWELFQRSQTVVEEQMAIVTDLYSGKYTEPIFRPLSPHTVKELNSPRPKSSQCESILYCPVFGRDGDFQGGLHLFRVSSVKSLDFKVLGGPAV